MARQAVLRGLLLGLPSLAAALFDAQALVQHSLGPQSTRGGEELLRRQLHMSNLTLARMASLIQEQRRLIGGQGSTREVMDLVAKDNEQTLGHHKSQKILSHAWKEIFRRVNTSGASNPYAMLQQAKAALIQTGAMEVMRNSALRSSRVLKKAEGTVPLDSMVVGFRSSIAPWNNLFKMFAWPLVKAQVTLFTNFFGPQGNAARLCLTSDVACDSTYYAHRVSEFSGINVIAGPAKWDNVPGWTFGTSGGLDDYGPFSVADFGWKWTLAKEPETVNFQWDLTLADSETLQAHTHTHVERANLLQTEAEAMKESEKRFIQTHGSTWFGHTWCSPEWENTPLVIPDETIPYPSKEELRAKNKPKEVEAVQKIEEWQPEAEPPL